ncbi:tyrosine-type recombinase/integrase [Lysinibacillus antri]|uniref:Integrase n=1 Tax=Lysinibacillus antri TaxID=2498145 RepID=A0A3S0R6V8_9BACI|nr:tyrosine-type recombinase/integrase [Lysinibacillus antri]RUL53957.1 integrase [Lysinibacillus antri]
MNCVEPIRSEEDIENLKKVLINQSYRDYFFFLLGINTGLKLTDLLNLKFKDFKEQEGVMYLIINNIKYPVANIVKDSFYTYKKIRKENIEDCYVFASRKGNEPIDRSHAYRILNDAAQKIGLSSKVGTHTLRKTFGYHFYKKYGDLKHLQKLFNHSTSKQTLNYIGISEENTPKKVIELNL